MMDSYITLNVNGFSSLPKRLATYRLLRKHKAIGLLQETHTIESDEKLIENEWGGSVLASHGSKNSKGVMILMPKNLNYENIFRDDEGRVVACYVSSMNATFCNCYSPVHSRPKEQYAFYNDFIKYTNNMPNHYVAATQTIFSTLN